MNTETNTEITVVRTGRVTLMSDIRRRRRESFVVQEWSDGTMFYYLGSAARTPDGWVDLTECHRDSVIWDS